jgi:hypothetical protein
MNTDTDAVKSELREAARQFHNLTQGDSSVIIRAPSAEKRDAIIAAGERLRAALAPAQAHAEEVQWEAHLAEIVEHTIETLARQLDLIAERAPGAFLDKVPVVRSLTAHKQRLERALAERNTSFAAPSTGNPT